MLISTLTNELFRTMLMAVLWTNWTVTNMVYPLERVVYPPLTNETPAEIINYGLPRTQQHGKLYTNYYVQIIFEEQNRLYKIATIEVTNQLTIRAIGPLKREQIMEPDVQSFYWAIPVLQGIPAPITNNLPDIDPDVDPPPVEPINPDVPIPDLLRRLQRKELK